MLGIAEEPITNPHRLSLFDKLHNAPLFDKLVEKLRNIPDVPVAEGRPLPLPFDKWAGLTREEATDLIERAQTAARSMLHKLSGAPEEAAPDILLEEYQRTIDYKA
jgi:hypothetical protein